MRLAHISLYGCLLLAPLLLPLSGYRGGASGHEVSFEREAFALPSRLSGPLILANPRRSGLLAAFKAPFAAGLPGRQSPLKILGIWVQLQEAWFTLQEHLGIPMKVKVRQATSKEEDIIALITYQCYVMQKGYAPPNAEKRLVPYRDYKYLKATHTLVAVKRGRVVGAINYTLDNIYGFPLEKDFQPEVERLRREGRKVAAVWSFVIAPESQQDIRVALGLMKTVRAELRKNRINAGLFVVNPLKHKKRYINLLQMEPIAESESTDGLQNAPGVLLLGNPQESREPVRRTTSPIKWNYVLPWFKAIPTLHMSRLQTVSA